MTTSWDDGDPRDARVAELLSKYGLAGTFYIPRKAPNVVMSDAEVKAISERYEIGAHTLTHPRLTTLDDAKARTEIDGSKHWVEDLTGRECEMFCPPEGKFTDAHRAIAETSGYRGIRTVELLSLDTPRTTRTLAELPTSVQVHPHPRAAYIRNALRRRSLSALWTFARAGCPTDWPTLARQLLERVRTHGGVFHLWGHSWEIDDNGQWKALESVLQTMAEYCGTVRPMTNGQLTHPESGQAIAS